MTRRRPADVAAIVALGSNLPWRGRDPRAILEAALTKLGAFGTVAARSGWWRTTAWPDPADPPFHNLCARLETDTPPDALMAALLDLEVAFGRVRTSPNAPRTLDLDLIDYDGRTLDLAASGGRPALRLPHPRMHERAFVLLPLIDVAPTWRHPELGLTAGSLAARLTPEARAGAWREA